MANDIHGTAHSSGHGVDYDRGDLGAKGIFIFLLVLVLLGIPVYFISRGLYGYWTRGTNANDKPAEAVILPQRDLTALFPEPRLQPSPAGHLKDFRAEQERILNSYGWVDQKTGVVHIPIQVAMQEVVKRGLPTRTASGGAQAGAPKKTASTTSGK